MLKSRKLDVILKSRHEQIVTIWIPNGCKKNPLLLFKKIILFQKLKRKRNNQITHFISKLDFILG